MYFIKTFRNFSQEAVELISNKAYSSDEFQAMAIKFIYGADVMSHSYSHPQKEWRYDKTESMPKSYLKADATSYQAAMDYGQKLITAVYTQNRLTVKRHLRDAQKELYRVFLDQGIKVYLPNSAIALEVRAEDMLQQDLDAFNSYDSKYWDSQKKSIQSCASKHEYTDEELSFYCRAFQVNAPQWFISQYNRKCQGTAKSGATYTLWAECPMITSKPNATYSFEYQGDKFTGYNGNLDDNGGSGDHVPYTLQRDSAPHALGITQRQLLVDSIDYFLSLPAVEAQPFLADNFRIVDGKIVELSQEDIEAEELAIIQETYKELWAV